MALLVGEVLPLTVPCSAAEDLPSAEEQDRERKAKQPEADVDQR
jgi:hypothetical protein